MTFNIWCSGGYSIIQCCQAIEQVRPDIVGIQEASRGVVQFMADYLGYYYNQSRRVLSRFPITSSDQSKYLVDVHIGQRIVQVCNIHAKAAPYPPHLLHCKKQSIEEVCLSERRVQLNSITNELEEEKRFRNKPISDSDGRFQHTKSFGLSTRSSTCPLECVNSLSIILMDTYYHAEAHDRQVGEEPPLGITWTPIPAREPDQVFDRIDFIYAGGDEFIVLNSFTRDGENGPSPWPSDHRAVVSDLSFK